MTFIGRGEKKMRRGQGRGEKVKAKKIKEERKGRRR